jgi:hypothetical protein
MFAICDGAVRGSTKGAKALFNQNRTAMRGKMKAQERKILQGKGENREKPCFLRWEEN